jgi:hypothetical protein
MITHDHITTTMLAKNASGNGYKRLSEAELAVRDICIRTELANGGKPKDLAAELGITRQRVEQIRDEGAEGETAGDLVA